MKWIVLPILLIRSMSPTFAQHVAAWTRGTLVMPLGNKWSTSAEFQYRRQNDLEKYNPLHSSLLTSYRHWIGYRLNDHALVELSPFAYFLSYKLIECESDRNKAPDREFRLTPALTLEQPLSGRMYVINRTALEYRIFSGSHNIVRLRNKTGFRYDLGGWLLNGYYELLVNNYGVRKKNFLDQYRAGISIGHSLSSNVKIEAGYLRIARQTKDADRIVKENDAILNITYRLNNE